MWLYQLKKTRFWPSLVKLYDFAIYNWKQLKKIIVFVSKRKESSKAFFFFSSYGTGGAEKVHLEIVKLFTDLTPVVFICGPSLDERYKLEFEKVSVVQNIYDETKNHDTFRKIWAILIAKYINNQKTVFTLGCDVSFYYEIIPKLNNSIKKADLFHTFVHKHELGPEIWSLDVTNLIDARITISNKVKKEFSNWYNEHQIETTYLDRIRVVKNFVSTPSQIANKNWGNNLNVLFVCRPSYIKRADIAAKIAKRLFGNGFTFEFIGPNLENTIDPELHPFINFSGNINDVEIMKEKYRHSHFLIVCSSREGTPMVIMEAMSYGVVPVCNNVGGIAEMFINEKEGFLLEYSADEHTQIEMFCKKLISIKNQHENLTNISKNAFLSAKENFGFDRFKKEWRETLLT